MNFAPLSCSTDAMRCSILRASTGEGAAAAVPMKSVSAKIDRVARTGSGLHVAVELGRRERALEIAEASLSLHLARRVDEPAHRGAVERGRKAHAPHARGLELAHREGLALDAGHEVHRFLQRGAHGAYRREIGQARRHQDVRACFLECLKAADGVVEIWVSPEVILRARG